VVFSAEDYEVFVGFAADVSVAHVVQIDGFGLFAAAVAGGVFGEVFGLALFPCGALEIAGVVEHAIWSESPKWCRGGLGLRDTTS
jgi:hypothetical protein